MSPPGEHREDPAAEDPAAAELARSLSADRPVPSPSLRSSIRAAISSRGRIASRPPNLHVLVAAYLIAGLVLLAIAALGVAGTGPFAP